jgi:GNAT superfamily N-acetyltransferase
MNDSDPERRVVLKALARDGQLVGFACVLLDADPGWGALLDNLHVTPELKRRGIGRELFEAARQWVAMRAPGTPMHLTVIEANRDACLFYERVGGTLVERVTKEVVPGTYLVVLRYQWRT